MSVKAPAGEELPARAGPKPLRAARRLGARARWRSRATSTALLLVGYGGYRGVSRWYVQRRRRCTVSRIVVHGNARLSSGEVRGAASTACRAATS